MRKKLVVDARMLHASGIGTVLQNILPFLKDDFELTLLGDPEEIRRFSWANNIQLKAFSAPIYSVAEQVMLPLLVPACDIFLSPHFNVPFSPIRAKKRVVIIHDVFHLASDTVKPLHKQYARLLLKAAVSFSDSIIAISDFTATEIRKYLKTGEKPIQKLILGVDKTHFNTLAIEEAVVDAVKEKYNLPSKYLLYVGNVKPHKNLIKLVEGLSLLDEKEALPLVIVGKKEGFLTGDDALFESISALDLNRRIFFTGFVDDVHLPIVYRLATLFIFPSLYEGFGLPPLEAMACGCPTIVSNAASLPEVCKDACVYVDASKPEQIAKAIRSSLQSEEVRNMLIQKGLHLVNSYSWQDSGKKLSSILSSVSET